jgi:hypothetical protein
LFEKGKKLRKANLKILDGKRKKHLGTFWKKMKKRLRKFEYDKSQKVSVNFQTLIQLHWGKFSQHRSPVLIIQAFLGILPGNRPEMIENVNNLVKY